MHTGQPHYSEVYAHTSFTEMFTEHLTQNNPSGQHLNKYEPKDLTHFILETDVGISKE